MQRKIIQWALTAWFMLLGCTSIAFGQTYGSPYKGHTSCRVIYPTGNSVTAPSYQFQSTSTLTSGLGNSVYATQVSEPFADRPSQSVRRNALGDPDENGIGEIPDPAPVGEPLILLGMAILYLIYKKKRNHKNISHHETSIIRR